MNDPLAALTPIEKDALQEIMNIAFGQTATDLSDVINMYVTLSVPYIDIFKIDEIYPYICNEISTNNDMSMTRQFFSGKFSGSSILIFPHGEGKKLLQLFDTHNEFAASSGYDIDILEKETLIEISNIIMGACISKIAGLLGDVVNYSPPCYYSQNQIHATLKNAFAGDDFAIFFKTMFHFKDFDASGFLFLVSNYCTLTWLKKAIEDYLAQYA